MGRIKNKKPFATEDTEATENERRNILALQESKIPHYERTNNHDGE
jgi:hypothetical protein